MSDERLTKITEAIRNLPKGELILRATHRGHLTTGLTADELHYLIDRLEERDELLSKAWFVSFGIDDFPEIAMMPDDSWQASQDGVGYGEKFSSLIDAYKALKLRSET